IGTTMTIEDVLRDVAQDILDGHGRPNPFHCTGRTSRYALKAAATFRAVELMLAPANRMRMVGADFRAPAAETTQRKVEQQFRVRLERFGILAPEAPQQAPFEEDDRADSRAVVGAVALDAHNVSGKPHVTRRIPRGG
ncbi:MAG: hypothetical protein U1E27_02240, partial [Kiritimatiellia bacterium]|nr:hypothetical protein [Kiritimatiellia bacterium]